MKTLYISILLACFAFTAKAAPAPSFPTMALLIGGYPLPEGDTYTHPIAIAQGTQQAFTFTISNIGTADLILSQVSAVYVGLSGTAAAEVVLDETNVISNNTVAPAGSVTFTVTSKSTTGPGSYSLVLSIANNDPAQNPYTGTVNYTIAAATATIDASEIGLALYPNPSTDGQFSVKGDVIVDKVIVYGATGTKEELTGSTLFYTRQKGILVVHVYTNKGIIVDKIFVQ